MTNVSQADMPVSVNGSVTFVLQFDDPVELATQPVWLALFVPFF
jgi:hypothetical protein